MAGLSTRARSTSCSSVNRGASAWAPPQPSSPASRIGERSACSRRGRGERRPGRAHAPTGPEAGSEIRIDRNQRGQADP